MNQQSFTQKRKQKKLSKELKASTLTDAYDKMFSMIEFVISKQGYIAHQINALEIKNGEITRVNAYYVKDHEINNVPGIVEKMLTRYPLVVHIFEAWTAPGHNVPPSEHPEKQDIVSVMMYTESSTFSSSCVRDIEKGTVTKGELFEPVSVGGRLKRTEPTKH